MPNRNAPTNPNVSMTLIPGFLVGLKTSVRGNVSYAKEVVESEHRLQSGEEKAKWTTERTIKNPKEHRKANQARMKARMTVVNVCATSAFGLLCPENKIDELNAAVIEAERIASAFNRTARLSHVEVRVITGQIAHNGIAAARAINSEVRDLIQMMADGAKTLNPKQIRRACAQANNIGSMLKPEAAAAIKGDIDKARAAARKIVKAGENAASVIDRATVRDIANARTAFLDISSPNEEVEAVESQGRVVELSPDPEPETAPEAPTTPLRTENQEG